MHRPFTRFSACLGRSTALLLLLLLPLLGWGQTAITPTHTGVIASFPSWTYSNIGQASGYLEFTSSSTPTLTSPVLDFTPYTTKTLRFTARTFGGVNATNNTITVSISTNNGANYTVFPTTAVPTSTSFTAFTYDLTSYTGTQVFVRIQTLASNGTRGAGVDDISITGTSGTPAPAGTITTTGTPLAAFTTTVGTPSAAQSYSVGGTDLTAAITVTAPTGYAVALESATPGTPGTFGSTVSTAAPTSGTVSSTPIYVRLTGATAGSPSGNVANASAGAPTQNVAVSGTVNNPVPTISSLSPSTVAAGAAAQTLTVNGTNFVSSSVVSFNGTARATAFVSATRLTISLTTADLATQGTYDVTVATPAPGGGTTAATTFTVTAPAPNPVPAIGSLSPNTAVAGSGAFTLTINGTNFVSGATATFNNVSRTVTFVSATQLTVAVQATDVATAGTYDVVVTNPAPAGGASAPASFTVTPAPVSSTLLLYTFNSRVVTPDASSSPNVTGGDFADGQDISRNSTTNAYVTSNYTGGTTTRQGEEWVGFSLTPNSGYQASLSTIAFDDQVNTGTGKVDVLYSFNSDFSGAVMVGAVQNATTTLGSHSITLSGVTALQNITQTVYFRAFAYGLTNGSTTYRIDNVRLDGALAPAPTFVYYTKPTGDLNALATFGTNPDGTGTAPTSFSTANSTYNITGTGRTISAAWTVSGSGSKAVLASGASFTIPAGFNYTGPLDLAGTAYLTVLNSTPTVTLGSLSASSTVEYAQTTGTYTVPAATGGYGNLVLSNASKRFSGASQGIDVYGNLTIQNVTGVGGASTSSFTIITLLGNFNVLGTTTFDQTSTRKFTLTLAGIPSQPQTLAGNGNTIRLFRLNVQNPTSLSDANGGTPLELGNSSNNGGGYDITTGNTLALNSNTLSFMAGGNASIGTGTGTLTLSPTSSLNLESVDNFVGTLRPTPNAATLQNLRIATTAGDFLDVTQSLTVNGILNLDGGIYDIGVNKSLTLNGTVTGTGSIRGSSASDLLVGGTGALGTLSFTLGTAANSGTTQQLRNFTLNRANGTVALGTILAVNGTLALTNGILTTSSANLLTLVATASTTGGSASSFVSGPLARATAATAASTVFPIGQGTAYRPLRLDATSQTSATTYTGEIINSSARTTGVDAPLTRVSNIRYATLTPNAQPTGFSGTITLTFGSDDFVNNPQDGSLVVAKRNGAANWQSIGRTSATGAATTGAPVDGEITSAAFTSFSDFALASISGPNDNNQLTSNPLPVELSAFGAQRQADKAVAVKWTTASEKNADRFEVQRSLTGRDFVTVATAKAQGTSSKATAYAALDATAPAAVLYYRLRQVDLDGTVAYSPVATVAGTSAGAPLEWSVYPNPATTKLTVALPAAEGRTYRLLNTVGKVVGQGVAAEATPALDVQQLPAGTYILELRTAAGSQIRRFVKID